MRNWKYTLPFLLICLNLFGQNSDIIEGLKSKFKFSEYDKLEHIAKFNEDTILVAGYLLNSDNSIKNVVYQTTDKGNNWAKYYFNGDAWIYNIHFEKNGSIWMGGSDNYIHFSNNYGKKWTKLPKPFLPVNRVLSIYMKDSLNGISGGLHNGIAITNDNWKTTKQIPSPLDQKKYSIIENSSRDRIEKVQILDSIILINQNEHFYFSNLNLINWKEFNIPVLDFEINKLENNINLYSVSDKVFVLDTKLNLIKSFTKDSIYKNKIKKNISINFNLATFLDSEINLIKVKAVRFDSDGMSGGCVRIPLYKENINNSKIKNKDKIKELKNILLNVFDFENPKIENFNFSEIDINNYQNFYKKALEEREKVIIWGGDFSSQYKLNNENFINPKLVLENLSQEMFDSVYTKYEYSPTFNNSEPYIELEINNKNSEKLKISSHSATLFSLPWAIEYNGTKILSYDTKISEFVKSIIEINSNYYYKLLGGELIYRLIEEKINNEIRYKNGY
jgi:hypothetical protein